MVISQILKFPIRTLVDAKQKKKTNRWISFIITLVLIPSIYFGYRLVQKEKFVENAERYIDNIRVLEGNYLLQSEINSKNRSIKLIYVGTALSQEDKNLITEKAKDFSLAAADIEFQQGFSFEALTRKTNEVDNLKFEVNNLSQMLQDKNRHIDSLKSRYSIGQQILNEIRTIHPQIVKCSYSDTYIYTDTTGVAEKAEIVIFTTREKGLTKPEKEKINEWLKIRLKSSSIKTYFE